MSVLFVIGAGASYGNPDCEPHPPPLGARLYSELKVESQVARELDEEVVKILETGDFESGMELLWEREPVKITPLQIDLAKYFTKFKAGSDNYYNQLIKIIKKSKKKPVISTTNYDLLLEQCINDNGYYITYGGLPVELDNISLLKIHGSCNFLPDMKPDQIQGIGFVVPKEGGGILKANIKPASADESRSFCERSDSIAPAIAVYSKGKQVLHCGDFVKETQEQWAKEVDRASKIFVIGLRVVEHDRHIWDKLSGCNTWLGYVGLKKDCTDFLSWAETHGRKNAFALANSFEESLPVIERRLKS